MGTGTNISTGIQRPKVTDADVRDPVRLRDKLDRAYEEITALHAARADMQNQIDALQQSTTKSPLTGSQTAALNRVVQQGVAGFAAIPSVRQPPTGKPTALSGGIPLVIDEVTGKLWAYINGAWKSVLLA